MSKQSGINNYYYNKLITQSQLGYCLLFSKMIEDCYCAGGGLNYEKFICNVQVSRVECVNDHLIDKLKKVNHIINEFTIDIKASPDSRISITNLYIFLDYLLKDVSTKTLIKKYHTTHQAVKNTIIFFSEQLEYYLKRA